MKLLRCRLMGEMDSMRCFECYTNSLSGAHYPSRVLCKRENIVEEMEMLQNQEEQQEFELKGAA